MSNERAEKGNLQESLGRARGDAGKRGTFGIEVEKAARVLIQPMISRI